MRPNASFHVPGFFLRAVTRCDGAGPLNRLLDSGEKSRTLASEPGSFSTCTMRAAQSALAVSRRCFIMAVYALRSASRLALDIGESDRVGLPPESITRGKRFGSLLTQFGVQSIAPFFQVANHSTSARNPCERSPWRIREIGRES